MLAYTINQIKEIIKSIINIKEFTIIPIGNHELKRNLVYHIKISKDTSIIFKLYLKDNKRNREIISLKLLDQSQVKCPRIIKHGLLGDGTGWMLCNYIEGNPFDKEQINISFENKLNIFESMGEELGKIHSFKTFDFFGEWDKDGNSIDKIKDNFESFVSITESYAENIFRQEHTEKDLLIKAINKIRDNYDTVKEYRQPRLRHNDFDGRNILVKKTDNIWGLSAVIDFEHSTPGNVDSDIVGLYHRYFLENGYFEEAFLKGYNKYFRIENNFYKKLNFYLLRRGVGICSWACNESSDYYKEGLKLVKMFLDFDK